MAVGNNYGVVSTGDAAVFDNRTINLPAAAVSRPDDVAAPTGLTNLPSPRSAVFVDRCSAIAEIGLSMNNESREAASVICGLGGVGKSALALQYAHFNQTSYNPVWWVSAETSTSISISFANLAAGLNPFGLNGFTGTAEAAAWAVEWLQSHQGWLLIFDNAESPRELASTIGPLNSGAHLITTRRTAGWKGIAKKIPLGILPADASVELLMRSVDSHDDQESEAAAFGMIAEELGHLPLALEQAAAYIDCTAVDPAVYLDRLRGNPGQMFATRLANEASEDAGNQRTVSRIWQISLASISAQEPLADEILRALSWYSSEPLPRDVAYLFHEDALAVDRALGLLNSYSMINLTRRSIVVHRLVRAVARTPDADDPCRTVEQISRAAGKSQEALRKALPGDPISNFHGWGRWRELLPHVRALLALLDPEGDGPVVGDICLLASGFLQREGVYDVASEYARRAVDAFVRSEGPISPRSFSARSFLASSYRDSGDLESAERLHRENLAYCEEFYGERHHETLTARSNLAYTYSLMGDASRALKLGEATFRDHQRYLGGDHPHTLYAQANLASYFRAVGDLSRATEIFEESVEEHERVFGPEHPEAITVRSNLAFTLHLANELDRATVLYEQVLDDRVRVLGAEHADTELARRLLDEARRAGESPHQSE